MEVIGLARKVFVKVTLEVDSVGQVKPLAVTWEDGRVFEVDRVTDTRRAVSLKAGGTGMRYTCLIKNKPVYLFYEEPRWFMEGKEA
jgi:hypothetical protein